MPKLWNPIVRETFELEGTVTGHPATASGRLTTMPAERICTQGLTYRVGSGPSPTEGVVVLQLQELVPASANSQKACAKGRVWGHPEVPDGTLHITPPVMRVVTQCREFEISSQDFAAASGSTAQAA